MMPGITVWPLRSIVRAPCGTVTLDAAPTAAIFPFWITIVWFARGGAPVPSTIVTFVSATTGSLTVTNSRVVGDIEDTDCAESFVARTATAIRTSDLRISPPRYLSVILRERSDRRICCYHGKRNGSARTARATPYRIGCEQSEHPSLRSG